VNNETTIQIASINQNHFIKFIQKINNITETINHVTFESQIADHDFLNHTSVEFNILFHFFNSSFILSKIRILASIAIQRDKINQAIEARVKTIQRDLTSDNIIITYIKSEIDAANQDNL